MIFTGGHQTAGNRWERLTPVYEIEWRLRWNLIEFETFAGNNVQRNRRNWVFLSDFRPFQAINSKHNTYNLRFVHTKRSFLSN